MGGYRGFMIMAIEKLKAYIDMVSVAISKFQYSNIPVR